MVKSNRQETNSVMSAGLRWLWLLQKIRVVALFLFRTLKLWLAIFFMLCWLGCCFINEFLDLAIAVHSWCKRRLCGGGSSG